MTRKWLLAVAGLLAATAWAGPAMAGETVMQVPGFADFITVDGPTIWVTNKGRVERWSHDGKTAEVAVPHPCGAMAILGDSLWIADCQDRTLNRIDLKTAQRVAVVPTGIGSANGELNVVAGAGSIWVASDIKGAIARVDPATNQVVTSVVVAPESTYLAFGFGSLWAVSGSGQVIQKIDPATNTVVATAALGHQPGFLAAGEGGVWVQEQGDGTVARIDPVTGAVAGRLKVDDTLKYGDIDTGGGKVWLRTTDRQTFVVIDAATMTIRARIGNAAGSGALRYTPAGVWTTAHDHHTLSWWDAPADVAGPGHEVKP